MDSNPNHSGEGASSNEIMYHTSVYLLVFLFSGGNILILGHAGSVEVCTRQVLGKQFRSGPDFRDIVTKVPYCGLIKIQEDPKTKKWSVCDSPILTLTHGQNKNGQVKKIMYPL